MRPTAITAPVLLLLPLGCRTAEVPVETPPVPPEVVDTEVGESPTVEVDGRVGLAGVTWTEAVVGETEALDALPIVVAIHGLGSSGERFTGTMTGYAQPARIVYPSGPIPHNRGFSWFPFPSPFEAPAQLDEGLEVGVENLVPLIEHLHATYGARPVVTGFSQGGILSFGLAIRRPDLICGAVPVAGYFPVDRVSAGAEVDGTAIPPIRAMHGDADDLLPASHVRETVEALAARGVDATLETWPGVEHSYPRAVRERAHAAIAELAAGCRP